MGVEDEYNDYTEVLDFPKGRQDFALCYMCCNFLSFREIYLLLGTHQAEHCPQAECLCSGGLSGCAQGGLCPP